MPHPYSPNPPLRVRRFLDAARLRFIGRQYERNIGTRCDDGEWLIALLATAWSGMNLYSIARGMKNSDSLTVILRWMYQGNLQGSIPACYLAAFAVFSAVFLLVGVLSYIALYAGSHRLRIRLLSASCAFYTAIGICTALFGSLTFTLVLYFALAYNAGSLVLRLVREEGDARTGCLR